jgi:ribosomal subunit interface protein
MEIIFKGRQTDVPARFREYASTKLHKLVRLEKKAISVDVEVSVERNPRLASQKERVELTIWSGGPAIRAEAAAEDRMAALDLALAKLDSRLRRALDRRKNHYGTSAGPGALVSAGPLAAAPGLEPGGPDGMSVPAGRAADDGLAGGGAAEEEEAGTGQPDPASPHIAAAGESMVPIQMEGDGPLVVRQKFHHAKPITIDQALLEMELVGHDFYLFHDVDANLPSVVYRRHGYQYGVIRLVEASDGQAVPRPATAGDGARIPARRRPASASGSQAAMAP